MYALRVLNLEDSPGYRFLPLEEPSEQNERGWSTSLALLDATVAESQRCGAPMAVTVFPVELQLSEEALAMYREGIGVPLAATASDPSPQRRLREWAAARAVPLGHRRAAETLESELTRLGLLGGD